MVNRGLDAPIIGAPRNVIRHAKGAVEELAEFAGAPEVRPRE